MPTNFGCSISDTQCLVFQSVLLKELELEMCFENINSAAILIIQHVSKSGPKYLKIQAKFKVITKIYFFSLFFLQFTKTLWFTTDLPSK